jgi:hypothetical protein
MEPIVVFIGSEEANGIVFGRKRSFGLDLHQELGIDPSQDN